MTKRLILIMLLLSSLFSWQYFSAPSPSLSSTLEIDIPPEYHARYDLIKCPLSGLEKEFSSRFPGQIATYRHQTGTIIFRQVRGATRRLHDSANCLQSSGFQLSGHSVENDQKGRTWTSYTARNSKNALSVRSIIIEQETGSSWASVEEWFWRAFFNAPSKTYLAITEISDEVRRGEFY